MRRIRPIAFAASLLASLVVAGCAGSTTIDGFTLGAEITCSGPVGVDEATLDRGCAGDLKRATAALDAREPGHDAVVSVEMYSDGTQPGPIDVIGDAPPPTPAPRHPGPFVTVFVFTLADGSKRATGVACEDVEPVVCVGVGSYPLIQLGDLVTCAPESPVEPDAGLTCAQLIACATSGLWSTAPPEIDAVRVYRPKEQPRKSGDLGPTSGGWVVVFDFANDAQMQVYVSLPSNCRR